MANLGADIPMTVDTLFLVGSITKVWTATAVMTFVDEGRLGLDDPVAEHLSDLALADHSARELITVRMLLAHTSGLDAGDMIIDRGRNPDAIELYVRSLGDRGQLHRPGERFSYCNAGFVILGRLLEKLSGQTYDQVMVERVFEPLRLHRTSTRIEDAILGRVASGHYPDGSGGWKTSATWMLPFAMGPAGSTLVSTPAEVLSFAAAHIDDRLAAMRAKQIDHPIPLGWGHGLGWMTARLGDLDAVHHSGGSYGGHANLIVLPSEGFAMITFVNCLGGEAAVKLIQQGVLAAAFGARGPELVPPAWTDTPDDGGLERYEGVYERWGFRYEVKANGNQLEAKIEIDPKLAAFAGASSSIELALTASGRGCFRPAALPGGPPSTAFVGEGRTDLLYSGGRLARRVS
jgi:CubicO group peptidase (beta-lactamase class C family)